MYACDKCKKVITTSIYAKVVVSRGGTMYSGSYKEFGNISSGEYHLCSKCANSLQDFMRKEETP
jgi:hypothetical protein